MVIFGFGGWKDALSGISGEFTFQVFNVKAKAVDSITLTDGLTVATIFDEEINNVSVSYYIQTCTNSHLQLLATCYKQGILQQPGNRQISRLIAFFPWLICFKSENVKVNIKHGLVLYTGFAGSYLLL